MTRDRDTGGPDFIVIGAMKCATSTLAAQLGAQEGLFMTTPKEPNYFSDDAVYARGLDWYRSLFDAAVPGDLCGEASTHYTKRPDYPRTLERMRATCPDARLIYMIRDPMVRLVSHYIHAWSEAETRAGLEQALQEMPRLVNYGRYGWQIAPFVEAFGRDALLLTSLERQQVDPEGELARIAAHIGLSKGTAWRPIEAQNVSSSRVRKLPLHGLLIESGVARVLRRTLVPKSVRRRIRQSRQMSARPEIPTAAQGALEARFAEDREMLAEAFPGDPSLDLAYPFLPPVARG